MSESLGKDDSRVALVPSLQTLVEAEGLKAASLKVAVEEDDRGKLVIRDRHLVPVSDAEKAALWPVSSLRELFRGSRTPPPDMERFPPEYQPYFFFIEVHALLVCDGKRAPTDQQFEEVYSALRRRPDGKSLGEVHDFLWQVAALLLGKYELSEAEFAALFDRLARSASRLAERPVSRNYASYLQKNFPGIK